MKTNLAIVMLLFLSFYGNTQNTNDSLLNVFRTSKIEFDRISAYSALAMNIFRKNPDSAKRMLNSVEKWAYKSGDKRLIARYLDNKGSIYWFSGNYDSAVLQYKECIEYCKKNHLPDRQMNASNNLGALYRNLSNFDSAQHYLSEAYDLSGQITDKHLIAKLSYDLASLYSIRGYYLPSNEFYLKTLDLLKEINNKRLELNVNMGLGVLYQRMNKPHLSVFHSRKALILDLENDELNEASDIYNNLGVVYWINFKNFDSAQYYMNLARDLYENESDLRNKFTALANLGGLELDKKNVQTAINYMREANQLKLPYDDKYIRAALMINFGKAFTRTDNYDSAYIYTQKGLDIASEIGALEWKKNGYLGLLELDTLTGNYRSAFKNALLYNKISDSLSSENVKNKIAELEIVYQTKQKEKDILNLTEKDNLNQTIINKQRYLVFVILSAVALLLILIFHINKNRKKQKTLNHQLSIKNQEITNQNQLLEQQTDELTLLNQTKDKFFSVIAHDLRNPFNSLLGFLELLEHDYNKMDESEKISIIQTLNFSAQNTYNLLVNLLDWSKAQRGLIQNSPELIDLLSISQSAILLLETRSKEKKQIIQNMIPSGIKILADPTLSESMFINLINNSIKFTKKEGLISITCIEKPDFIEVCIADNGIGIPEEYHANIFELNSEFKRNGTNKELGTGLGLNLCKEFITLIGGEIWVKSVVGEGSKFYFTLPVATQKVG